MKISFTVVTKVFIELVLTCDCLMVPRTWILKGEETESVASLLLFVAPHPVQTQWQGQYRPPTSTGQKIGNPPNFTPLRPYHHPAKLGPHRPALLFEIRIIEPNSDMRFGHLLFSNFEFV
ncbi:MAG TPA: hypothetical protein VHS31_02195 [Tepidisphaeraceae bacterium]|nr:hypothetical protein [Tepidisphaeraceae bacterium]